MATGIEDSGFKVDKLTGNNYHTWKFQMKMCLIGKDLWGIVTGDETLNLKLQIKSNRRLEDEKIWLSLRFVCQYQMTFRFTFAQQGMQRKHGRVWNNILRGNRLLTKFSIAVNYMQQKWKREIA